MPNELTREQAKRRFLDFFSQLTEESVRERIHRTYAENVHFNDTLKDVHGIGALEEYLIESARALESCTVDLQDLAVSGESYYFRWTMDIQFKRFRKGKTTRSIGMSHVRFDDAGRIAFHQDYWDSSAGLFEHIPVVGSMIRMVKARL